MGDNGLSGIKAQPDIGKNYIYRLIHEALGFALPLITMLYISRVLGADGVGNYSYSYSVVTIFMMFALLGTVDYGEREIARNRDDAGLRSKLFWEIEIMSAVICLVCMIAWIVPVIADPVHRPFFLALTPFLLGSMFDISWFFTGLERIGRMVAANAAVRIFGVILVFVMVRSGSDLVLYCLITSLTMLAANLAMWPGLAKYLVRVSISDLSIFRHFRETVIYFLPTVATSIYTVLDKTLIGLITGDPFQNGYYELSARIIGVADGVSFVVLNFVLVARMSYLFTFKERDELRRIIEGSMDIILFMCFGTAFGLLGISHNLVPVLFGEGYAPVEMLIYMMLPLIPVIGISNCLGSHYYVPAGKRGISAIYIVSGAVTNLILNLCLIPFFGARGAVAASLAAEILITSLFLKNCDGYLSPGRIAALSYKRILTGIVMAAAVYMLGLLPLGRPLVLIIQLISGFIIYAGILTASGDTAVKGVFERIKLR
ncbi:MAG: oligosaccharide flippase family protein [Lachnospiraceae bacterium]|nr:oligosaccharide flippase family protein [Lachnospiraceae bacterium]